MILKPQFTTGVPQQLNKGLGHAGVFEINACVFIKHLIMLSTNEIESHVKVFIS